MESQYYKGVRFVEDTATYQNCPSQENLSFLNVLKEKLVEKSAAYTWMYTVMKLNKLSKSFENSQE